MSAPTYSYDTFISYSQEDLDWVESWLLPHLDAAGLRVCVDFRDFDIGAPRLVNIERAIDSSRHTLLILTPARLANEWSEFEELLVRSADPAARQRRVLPLMLKRCRPAQRIDLLTYADFTQAGRWDSELARLLDALTSKITLPQAIAVSDHDAGGRAPFILPQLDVSTFTGREHELADLQALIVGKGAPKLCTIVGLAGTGGVGKSALACHFAYQHRADFPGGVIGLRVDGKDLNTIAREFARHVVELDPDDDRDAPTLMQEVFGGRRMLLIFDNADSPAIRALRPGGELCAVIVTTRDRLLPDLLDISSAGKIDLSSLPEADALRLLRQLLGAERVATESEAASRIVALVGGLPLALQIVGATLRMQPGRSLASYAASLDLARLRVRGDEHMDVRASFALSLELLEPPEIDFFACLSVCAKDGFALRTAMAAGDCDEEAAHERLGYLYRMSLLNHVTGAASRFVFHPLLRQFANELAAERTLYEAAAERHAHLFIEQIKTHNNTDWAAVAAIAEDLDDIIVAARWLQTHNLPDYDFIFQLGAFFQQYGHWNEALTLIEVFLELAERRSDWYAIVQFRIQEAKYRSMRGEWSIALAALEPIAGLLSKIEPLTQRHWCEAIWLNTLGGVFQRQGRFSEAETAFRRSAEIGAELGNSRHLAMVLNTLGSVLQRQGQFAAAAAAFQRSVEIGERLGDRRHLAMALNSLGSVLQRQGQFAEAIDAFQKSHALLVELGDQRGQAMVLNSLGGVLQRQGQFAEAADAFRKSYSISEQLDDQRSLAMVLNSLGGVLQRQGQFAEAADAFRKSYSISEQLDDQRSLAMVLNSLGGVLQRQGQFAEAADALRKSYALLVELGDQRGQAMVLNSLGSVLQRQGQFAEAADAFRKSYSISKQLDDQRSLAMVLNSLGSVLQRQGQFADAADAFQRSAAIEEQIGNPRGQAMVLNSLGSTLQRQGRFVEAIDAFQRSAAIEEQLGNRRGQAMVLNSLGGVLQRQGQFVDAVDAFQHSYALLVETKDKRGQAMVLNSLGGVLQRQGQFAEAVDAFQRSAAIEEQIGNRRGQAMVHTALGKALLSHGHVEQAAEELRKGFEIDLGLENVRGIGIVAPMLIQALIRLHQSVEAQAICHRALAIAPQNKDLLELRYKLAAPEAPAVRPQPKQGRIKRILRHAQGYLYGFVEPDDRSPDVYFRESDVELSSLPKLLAGARVELDLTRQADGRLRGRNLRVLD